MLLCCEILSGFWSPRMCPLPDQASRPCELITPPSSHHCFGHMGAPYLSHSEPALREPFAPVVRAPLAKHPNQLSLQARRGCSPFWPQQGQAGDPWASEQMSLYSMFVDTPQMFKVLRKGRDWGGTAGNCGVGSMAASGVLLASL